jgi:hypothetical protein
MFCDPSLAPTKNYISLAHRLTEGNPVSLGKLILGEDYRFLHLTTSNMLSGKKNLVLVARGGLSRCGLTCIFNEASPTSQFWSAIPSPTNLEDKSCALIMAKPYTDSLVAD